MPTNLFPSATVVTFATSECVDYLLLRRWHIQDMAVPHSSVRHGCRTTARSFTVADACRVFRAISKGRIAIRDYTRMNGFAQYLASCRQDQDAKKPYKAVAARVSFDGGSLKLMSSTCPIESPVSKMRV
jgi:hypothetical protein